MRVGIDAHALGSRLGGNETYTRNLIRAHSAATDNVGLFFGEDIFLAVASILLIQGALAGFGIQLTPFQLSVWAIPSAICAFLVQGARLLLLDRQLGRRP